MPNFRRNRPRHSGRTAREKSSDWRYPQISRGNSERSTAANKRRALMADPTPIIRVSIIEDRGPDDWQYLWDWIEI